MNKNTLWFRTPAPDYEHALPVGNGRLGAMVSGGIQKERIALNDDTLWSGYARSVGMDGAYDRYMKRIRKKILEEKNYDEAEDLCERIQGAYNESYLCAGELLLDFDCGKAAGNYTRYLDLRDGIAGTAFDCGGVHYTREVFASYPDDVIVIRLAADRAGQLSFTGRPDSMIRHTKAGYGDRFALQGQAPRHVEPEYLELGPGGPGAIFYDEEWEHKKGLRFECQFRILHRDGVLRTDNNGFSLRNGTEAVILLWIGTNYNRERFRDKKDLFRGQIEDMDLEEAGRLALDRAAAAGYETVRQRHLADVRAYFDRVSLNLMGEDAANDLPTDERKRRYAAGHADRGLEQLAFDFGRYLLWSCSRPGTQAANLQGIWCWQLRPAWSGNYTTNSNVQMNYYGAETLGMPECHLPFLDLLSELTHTGELTAKTYYNARGWCVHHNTDLWRATDPIGWGRQDSKWSFWPTAGTWMSYHIWEHYLFTHDLAFLKEYYPVLKGAALFAADMMCDLGDDTLGICPATVPERRFTKPDGTRFAVGAGAASDYEFVLDLFDAAEKAFPLVGDTDAAFLDELAGIRKRLPPLPFRADGSLAHWVTEKDAESEDYMWVDILCGLYPGNCLTDPDETMKEKLYATLRHTERPAFWGYDWSMGAYARLSDGENAHRCLNAHLTKVTFDNLLGLNHGVFQIDANLGCIAGMAEMLLQSKEGTVTLLPALPAAWQNGSVRGLRARGCVTVDITWEKSRLTAASLTSSEDQTVTVRNGTDGTFRTVSLTAGLPCRLQF